MNKHTMPSHDALEQLGKYYVLFLKQPQQRQYLLTRIEELTDLICQDDTVLLSVKHRALNKVASLRNLLRE
jgi:hypothetical protein